MNPHAMIDLETIDTRTSAVVVSIGICVFDFDTFHIVDEYYEIPHREQQHDVGRTSSHQTMGWWQLQSEAARSVFTLPSKEVHAVLDVLDHALYGVNGVWGNGADFDCAIVGSLYDSFGRARPWSYSKNRCLRTLKNVLLPKRYIKPERQGVHHNALDDARHQVLQLKAICEATGIRF